MSYRISAIDHEYGEGVHILDDPFLTTQLALLCQPSVGQPQFNHLIRTLYTSLIRTVINHAFPQVLTEIDTRMKAHTARGVIKGSLIDRSTPTVVVDIARAGILPSQICYDTLNEILDPMVVRQDHLIMARTVDADNQVTGAAITGKKIGGEIQDRILLLPDPMGATGGSLSTAIQSYLDGDMGTPREVILLNLIITPEFIRRIKTDCPNAKIYALRLDRGMSTARALDAKPGTYWDEESGLNAEQYIIPGGGGFGELMNNSWV